MYVLVRSDIPAADQIVQVGHACLAAAWQFPPPPALCHLVVLSVPSQMALLSALDRLEANGIRYTLFVEPDDAMGATAACSAPIQGQARAVLRRYSLWRADNNAARPRGPPHNTA